MDYFSLFFSDELLNNIVVETNRYMRQKISELQLRPRSIWNSWSDVSWGMFRNISHSEELQKVLV
jgi:hypothetical protein